MTLREFKDFYSSIYKSPSDFIQENSDRFDLFLRYMKIDFSLEHYQVPAAYVVSRFKDIWYTDAPGMGKTPTTIAAMSDMYKRGSKKFLVVVLASLVGQWKSSFQKFSSFTVDVAKGTQASRYKAYNSFNQEDADVLLIPYTTLVTDFDVVKQFKFDALICDESDYMKSVDSLAFKAIMKLSASISQIKLLTGTPFTGKLEDSFYALMILSHGSISYWQLLNTYCKLRKVEVPIYDKKTGFKRTIKTNVIDSYLNIDKFKELTNIYMFGRSFEETGATLPELRDHFIKVQKTEKLAAFQKLTLAGVFVQPNHERIKLNSLQKISYLHRGTHALSLLYPSTTTRNPKKEALLSLIDSLGDEQVTIFCNYKKVPEEIYEILNEKGGCSRCDGGITGNSRLNSIEAFKEGKNKYLIITLAGYCGLDLFNCKNLIIYDFIYSRAKFDQIKGRVARKNSISPVSDIYYIYCEDSIDAAVWSLLEARKNMMDFFETEESTSQEILKSLSKNAGVQLSIL